MTWQICTGLDFLSEEALEFFRTEIDQSGFVHDPCPFEYWREVEGMESNRISNNRYLTR